MADGSQFAQTAAIGERAARLAYVAAAAHGVPFNAMPDWTQSELGRRVPRSRLQRAVGPVRPENPHKKTPGPQGVRRLVRQAPLIRDAVVVDETALGLVRTLLRIANDGMPQPDLLAALELLPGVRQVIEIDSTREVLVIAVTPTTEQAADLRAQVEELTPGRGVRRDLIGFESHRPALATWKRVAAEALRERPGD